jgi:hypothetical protein
MQKIENTYVVIKWNSKATGIIPRREKQLKEARFGPRPHQDIQKSVLLDIYHIVYHQIFMKTEKFSFLREVPRTRKKLPIKR